jgi:hypothetical protein
VHGACDRIAEDLGLAYADREDVPEANQRVIAAVLGLAQVHVANEALHVEREEAGAHGEDERKHQVGRTHQ